jgi:hypothetical protein
VKRLSVPPDLLVVGVTTLAAFAVWSSTDGGYAEVVWYPVGIILLLLAVMLVWSAPWRRLGHRSLIAAAGLAGYTAWSFLSIIWAGDRGLDLQRRFGWPAPDWESDPGFRVGSSVGPAGNAGDEYRFERELVQPGHDFAVRRQAGA